MEGFELDPDEQHLIRKPVIRGFCWFCLAVAGLGLALISLGLLL